MRVVPFFVSVSLFFTPLLSLAQAAALDGSARGTGEPGSAELERVAGRNGGEESVADWAGKEYASEAGDEGKLLALLLQLRDLEYKILRSPAVGKTAQGGNPQVAAGNLQIEIGNVQAQAINVQAELNNVGGSQEGNATGASKHGVLVSVVGGKPPVIHEPVTGHTDEHEEHRPSSHAVTTNQPIIHAATEHAAEHTTVHRPSSHAITTKRPLNEPGRDGDVIDDQLSEIGKNYGLSVERLLKILQEQGSREDAASSEVKAEVKAEEQELEETAIEAEAPVENVRSILTEKLARARELIDQLKNLEAEIDEELQNWAK